MKFTTSVISKPGGREENQDCSGFKIFNHAGCWVLGDGLGGHRGGRVASGIAVDKIIESFKTNPEMSHDALIKYLEAAQNGIIARQEEDDMLYSMRTTIVILASDFKSAMWTHVGYSRLYHFRSGKIIFQTKDHSVPQAMADAGDILYEEIRYHEDRNRLLRSLGKEGDLRPKISESSCPLEQGDVFLLCTDGFWEYVIELEMEKDLSISKDMDEWLARMEIRIKERAIKNHDNYSAVAIRAGREK